MRAILLLLLSGSIALAGDDLGAWPAYSGQSSQQQAASFTISATTGSIQEVATVTPFNSSTSAQYSGTVGVTGTIAANAKRVQANITNTGTLAIFVKLSGTVAPSSTNFDYAIPAMASANYPTLTIGAGITGAIVVSSGTSGTESFNVSQILRP